MDENKQPSYPEQYQTGRTVPPKNYGGVIAFLLILIIFLCGIVTMLSLMNIHLFRMVKTQQTQDVSLQLRSYGTEADQEEQMPAVAAEIGDRQGRLGFSGQEITPFYQQYYQIPLGIYISEVDPDSDCYKKGLRAGDILIGFNGHEITDSATLKDLLSLEKPGNSAQLTILRDGNEHLLNVIIGSEEGE